MSKHFNISTRQERHDRTILKYDNLPLFFGKTLNRYEIKAKLTIVDSRFNVNRRFRRHDE